MTITMEPAFQTSMQTKPQYRHRPFRATDQPLTSRLTVAGELHERPPIAVPTPTGVHTGSMIRRRVVVKGRVQGVFYREGCRREAQRLGVRGWVLNRADGQVEAVLEGQPEDVEAMIKWARVGPLHAYVTGVDVVDEQPESLAGFEVR